MSQSLSIVAAGLISLIMGCSGSRATDPTDDLGELSSILTGEAARSLGTDGRFILDTHQPDTRPVMSESQARAAAQFLANVLAPNLASDLQREHQGPIDFSSLKVCGPAYFARSPFEPISDEHNEVWVYHYGSYWIVAACDGNNKPAISIAVAVNAVTFRQRADGQWFVPPSPALILGIPPTWSGALPVSPEKAALLAAQLSGRRVATVPTLVTPFTSEEVPQGARWSFELDGDVAIRGDSTGRITQQQTVTIGSTRVPSSAGLRGPIAPFIVKPDERRVLEFMVPTLSGPFIPLRLVVRPGTAIDMERATINP